VCVYSRARFVQRGQRQAQRAVGDEALRVAFVEACGGDPR